MTHLLASLLRPDYIAVLKARMMEQHRNNTSLSRLTGYSIPHIGNIFKRNGGSDDAIAAVCKALNLDIRKDLFKPELSGESQSQEGNENAEVTASTEGQ